MQDQSPQRKLAAILIADAVGYSRQMGEDEERALRVLETRRNAIESEVAAHHGRVFAEAGDSVVAEFHSAVDALKAALAMQRAIADLNKEAPEAERMEFRIGINVGDVMIAGSNLFGDGVNIAERLQTLAEPGGICISGGVHEQVRNKLHLDFADLGARQLKNIAHPVMAFLVGQGKGQPSKATTLPGRRRLTSAASILAVAVLVGGGVLYLRHWQTIEQSLKSRSGPPTIAVLPFANLGGDSSQDYFCDGITQDTIAALGRFSNLYVLANSATAKFKGGTADELRQQLGAQYVVTGSVRRSRDRIRVSVDLTDADKNLQLWSRQFDGENTDIFDVQDEITRNITGALAIKLSRIEAERAFAKETRKLDAYEYYLRGQTELEKAERPNLFAARTMFEKAISLDARYAAAISALGDTYLAEATRGYTEFAGDALQKAEQLGRQAASLSPGLTEAHQLLAFVHLAKGEYGRGIDETRRAIEINPSDAYAHASLGAMLMWIGDAEGAITALERARIFDPTLHRDPMYSLGLAYYLVGRYDDALTTLEPIAGDGADYSIYAGLAATYAQLGRKQDAERTAADVMRLWPFFKISPYVEQWKDDKARQHLADGLAKAGLK